jgi:hypothetical protein
MSHDQSAFKKVAVLTGLTMLVGGAEISEVNAATLNQTIAFDFSVSPFENTASTPDTLHFDQFNTSMGTLTDVAFSLISNIGASGTWFDISATATVDGALISPAASDTGAYDFGPVVNGALSPSPPLSFYEGSTTFAVSLLLEAGSESSATVTWDPVSDNGLTVTYIFTPATSATPLPAALPLFTTGLAGLGFTTWRSRRKQKTKKQT